MHGDYRIDNAILDHDDPAQVHAVVDWEMAALGDPSAELGLHLMYADGAASNSPADLPQRYAPAICYSLAQLELYLGLGYFKNAGIAEIIRARQACEPDTHGQ